MTPSRAHVVTTRLGIAAGGAGAFPQGSTAADWAAEPRGGTYLSVHVPFCGLEPRGLRSVHRARARRDLVALHQRANAVRAAIPDAALARFVIDSNTSAYLNETALAEVFDIAETVARLPQVTNATARTNLP